MPTAKNDVVERRGRRSACLAGALRKLIDWAEEDYPGYELRSMSAGIRKDEDLASFLDVIVECWKQIDILMTFWALKPSRTSADVINKQTVRHLHDINPERVRERKAPEFFVSQSTDQQQFLSYNPLSIDSTLFTQ